MADSTEAAEPLKERFWTETDTDLHGAIVAPLELTIADFDAMKAFFEQVKAKEQNEKLAQFARETLDNLDKMQKDVETFAKKEQVSGVAFQREYDLLFKSAGLKGSYENLPFSARRGMSRS